MTTKMITVPADDVMCLRVGSLEEYREKIAAREARSRTQISSFFIPDGSPTHPKDRTVFASMRSAIGLPEAHTMRQILFPA